MKYLQLNDIDCYKHALALSNYVWNIVIKWERFSKYTIGMQFVNSIDSVSANIAEGFGRFHKLDKIHFYHISFGSVTESLDWNQKAKIRKLISDAEYLHILTELKSLPKEINQLIKYTRTKLQQ